MSSKFGSWYLTNASLPTPAKDVKCSILKPKQKATFFCILFVKLANPNLPIPQNQETYIILYRLLMSTSFNSLQLLRIHLVFVSSNSKTNVVRNVIVITCSYSRAAWLMTF